MKFKLSKSRLRLKGTYGNLMVQGSGMIGLDKRKDMLEFYFSRSSSSFFDYPVPKFNMKYG